MRKTLLAACGALALLTAPAAAGVPTPHRLSYQGLARNTSNQPVVSGDIRVRVYDAATGGVLVYDSGTEFTGAISTGVFNVLLGGGAALMLDDTRQYHLELDINGQEVVGDAAGGRQAFWPAGGDLSRTDLETRLSTLEGAVFGSCSPGNYNLNGSPTDGCEFVLDASGVYVDVNDPGADDGAGCGQGPVGTCSGCKPCLSIARGLAVAAALGRTTVYIADGTYTEAVNLLNGRSLLGGFRGITWERHVSSTATVLRGESVSGNHKRAVIGANITSPTVVDGFVIFGPQATAAGGNSYAVYLSNSGGVTLRDNTIIGGVGGPGSDGSAGPAGTDGVAGTAGANALQSPTSTCSGLDRTGGAGGSLTCAATNVSGGAGGGNRCTPVANSEFSGIDGATATGAGGGTGGDAGDDAQLQTGVCTVPTNPTLGANGGNGTAGAIGAAGSGASNSVGSVASSHWIASPGGIGIAGTFGRGGGGGGAGGGSDGISPEHDVLGGSGGGGGSGACGGTGGGVAVGGGGSFCVFVTTGSAPVITSNVLIRGYGGFGGRGGLGGRGGAAGVGAAGGAASFFCSGAGGRGGDGGAGGHGGGGGGAAGGISCGIFTFGVGAPSYSGTNTFSGGAGGAAGGVGLSLGNAGTAGVAGALTTVTSQ